MKKALRILNRLLHPPGWVLFPVPSVAFAALIFIFVTGQSRGTLASFVYLLSAYSLIILVLPLPKRMRSAGETLLQWMNGTAFGGRYLTDPAFRSSINLCRGMTVNFLSAAFRAAVGILYASIWFISMAVYDLALGALRLSLVLRYRRRSRLDELRCYRRTAWLLFLLNIPMGGMILLMVRTNSGYSYPGHVIYLSALCAFSTMICSIINLIKSRRLGSPVLSASRVLNFIAALMSILGLQTALIARFSAGNDRFRMTMNAITGGIVWGGTILIAAGMLCRSRRMQDEVKLVEQIRE